MKTSHATHSGVAVADSDDNLFKTLARVAPVGIFRTDDQGKCIYVNERWCEMAGLTPEQALGDGWARALHPEDRSKVALAWSRCALTEDIFCLEYRFLDPQGKVTWLLGQAAAERSPSGTRKGYVGTITDITLQRAASEALRRSQEQLESILDHTRSAVFIKDLEGRYVFNNKASLAFSGRPFHEVLGRTDHELYPKPVADEYRGNDLQVMSSGMDLQFEEASSDEARRYSTQKFPLLDSTGKPYGVCGISTDITDYKSVEAELERANQSLRTLSHRLLEVQEVERRRIAHELHDGLGQVLAALKLDLGGMGRKPSAAKLLQCMETLDEAQRQVRDLSHDLRPPSLDDIGIEAALRSIVDQHRSVADQRVTFKCEVGPLRPRKEIEVAAYRVVQEALSNIIRHAKANNIGVTLCRFQSDLHLEVTDDGIGFDVATVLTRTGPNRGIGVESMRERMSRIGGYVNILSSLGGGTRITAGFPNAWPENELSTEAPTRARVLCVDDHALIRAGIRAILENIDGIDVIGEAQDGRSALQLVESTEPDIVISDIKMPVMDGLALTEAIARTHPKVRTLILSLYPDSEYVEKAFQSGAAGYLVKDNAQEELEMAIRAIMRGHSYISPSVSNPILRRAARSAQQATDLPQRQLEILRLLADGSNTKEIATSLNISPKTVDAHRARIMRRVGVRDAAGLVRFAVQNANSLAAR